MNTTYLSLRQAAERCGKSKSTISNALKNGKISYIEKNISGYKIDPSEVDRVYPRVHNEPQEGHLKNPTEHAEIKILETKLEAKDAMIERLQTEVEDLRQQRDKWEKQANAQTRLLEHQSKKKSWFSFGKK